VTSINDLQDKIIQAFTNLSEWLDKYEHLIKLGKNLPPMDSHLKTEEHAVSGCQSKVWITANISDGKVNYQADSDTLITKGLIALVVQVMDQQTPEDIARTELYFIEKIGLKTNLSPSRSNGLMSIVKQMKRLAHQLQVGIN